MDYLRSFTIGSSGPVFLQHLALLSLVPEGSFGFSYKFYSIILPLYYGLMNVLALRLGKSYNLSLGTRLFVISIISIVFVVNLNYNFSRKHYKPYKDYDRNEWIRYIFRNGARHLVVFNLIVYFFEKYFSQSPALKLFIIGSSAFSFLTTFMKVAWLDNKGKVNYNYKLFAPLEPLIHGIGLLSQIYIVHNLLGYDLQTAFIFRGFYVPIMWITLASTFKAYGYVGTEWLLPFVRFTVSHIARLYILYKLVTLLV